LVGSTTGDSSAGPQRRPANTGIASNSGFETAAAKKLPTMSRPCRYGIATQAEGEAEGLPKCERNLFSKRPAPGGICEVAEGVFKKMAPPCEQLATPMQNS
jgi:hypothetical protein